MIRFRDYGWKQFEVSCDRCFMSFGKNFYDEKKAIEQWSTRPVPPIKRCGECKYQGGNISGNPNILCINMKPDDFCSYFEPREDKNMNK